MVIFNRRWSGRWFSKFLWQIVYGDDAPAYIHWWDNEDIEYDTFVTGNKILDVVNSYLSDDIFITSDWRFEIQSLTEHYENT